MNELSNLSPSSLRKAADLKERILALQAQLFQLLGESAAEAFESGRKARKRKLSRAGLAAIRAGVRKRMARQRGTGENGSPAPRRKRMVSAALRAARSAAAKARWKKAKAAGRNRL